MTAVLDERAPAAGEPYSDLTGMVRFGPCRALEHRFEVFVPNHAKQVREIGSLVRTFRDQTGASGPMARYVLAHPSSTGKSIFYRDGERLCEGRIASLDFRGALAWNINQAVIASSVERYWLMHAASVTREGYTIILPADMESGKTTTTAGLLREGFGYVTDEAVAVDPDTLWVTPFPKTLSIDPGSWHLFPELEQQHAVPKARQWHVPAADLGTETAQAPVPPPSIVVIPKYVGGSSTDVIPMTQAEAAFELSRMTFHFHHHPRRNLAAVGRLVRSASVVRMRIGTLEGAVDAVEDLLSQRILGER